MLKLVVRQGTGPALPGILLGLVTAFALTGAMQSLLFGVSARDPLTFGLTGVLSMAVAVLACVVPARRATKVDPLTALRYE